jgi:predicted nucleic acid-binding protein
MDLLDIYLDTCCYGRRFDCQTDPNIKAETKAIKTIIRKCIAGGHRIIGSLAVTSEIGDISDNEKRKAIDDFYADTVTGDVPITKQGYARAAALEAAGLGAMDSRHLAAAETAGADFLLTTDAFFIKKCNNLKLSVVNVMNPRDFLNGGYL